jgi:hypothetical protein
MGQGRPGFGVIGLGQGPFGVMRRHSRSIPRRIP